MKKENRNRIPRKFNQIIGKTLINTNMDQIGDIFHIYKNDFGYLALNLRTGKYAYMFGNFIRNAEIFEIIEIN